MRSLTMKGTIVKSKTMRSAFSAITLAFIYFAGGCSSIDVAQDHDPAADFQTLTDWGWLPGTKADASASEDFDDQRLQTAIKDVLVAKGYLFTEQEPDFFVKHHFGADYDLQVNTFLDRFGYRYGSWWDGIGTLGGTSTFATREQENIITIDVISRDEPRALMWRGIATYNADADRTPTEQMEIIREAVGKMMEGFPPPVSAGIQ
jgi:hypothetical protein